MAEKKNLLLCLGILLLAATIVGFVNMGAVGAPIECEAEVTGGAAANKGKTNVAESPYFKHNDFYNMQSTDSLTILSKFKTFQQTTSYSCGPAAALMVEHHFFGDTVADDRSIAKYMGTSPINGTSTSGMTKYFSKERWLVKSSLKDKTPDTPERFKKFVLDNLRRNVPIIVENIDWGGHWRVIIGYDTMGTEMLGNDVLIMADPYDTADHLQDGYVIVPAEKFFYMWFDAHLFSRNEREQQWLTAEPLTLK